jgi:putative Mg2+ transporter-C (MgtC) family protein
MNLTITEFSLRILCSIAAGFFIGVERQWRHKSAGIRTNTLVSTGAALYVLLSLALTQEKGDVTRIIGQVVSGIGFLGAGIIFKEGLNIHGLTTAATVWCSSAIGCLSAAGFYKEALIGTLAILAINMLLVPIDLWLDKRKE